MPKKYMTIIFTIITVAIAIFGYIKYINLNQGEWLLGLSQAYVVICTLAAIAILWLIYFAIIRDFKMMWIPGGIRIVLIILVIGFIVTTRYNDDPKNVDKQYQASLEKDYQKSLPWLNKVENKEYFSKNLGISFQYISPTEYGGVVEIKESDDIIKLNLEKDSKGGGAIKVFSKDTKFTLLDYLNKKYNKTNPLCRFATYTKEGLGGTTLPSNYSVVVMYGDPATGEGCPVFGIEVEHKDGSEYVLNYFIMDNSHPEKYIFLSVPEYGFPAYKRKNANDFPPKWFETIVLK